MSNTHNVGTLEWQLLGRRGNSPMRSRASSVFEEQLRTLLANYGGSDIAGIWLDWADPRKEPIWLRAPGCEGEAA